METTIMDVPVSVMDGDVDRAAAQAALFVTMVPPEERIGPSPVPHVPPTDSDLYVDALVSFYLDGDLTSYAEEDAAALLSAVASASAVSVPPAPQRPLPVVAPSVGGPDYADVTSLPESQLETFVRASMRGIAPGDGITYTSMGKEMIGMSSSVSINRTVRIVGRVEPTVPADLFGRMASSHDRLVGGTDPMLREVGDYIAARDRAVPSGGMTGVYDVDRELGEWPEDSDPETPPPVLPPTEMSFVSGPPVPPVPEMRSKTERPLQVERMVAYYFNPSRSSVPDPPRITAARMLELLAVPAAAPSTATVRLTSENVERFLEENDPMGRYEVI
jgi:hypothetical protein